MSVEVRLRILKIAKKNSNHLYVVLLVTRIHHAVVYDMPTAAAPEKAMANRRRLRVSGGLEKDVITSSRLPERKRVQLTSSERGLRNPNLRR